MPIIAADKFQYFRPSLDIQNIQGDIGVAGLPQVSDAASVANTQAGRELAQQIQDWGRNIQERIIKEDVSQHMFAALAELTDAEIEVQRHPDHRTMVQRFQERVKGIYDSHAASLGSSAARTIFQEKYATYSSSKSNAIIWKAFEREVEAEQAGVAEKQRNALLQMSTATSLSEIHGITAEVEDDLNDMVRHGIVSEKWATESMQIFRGQVGDLAVQTHLAADPAGTLALLASDQWDDYYPGLDPLKRIQTMRTAETRIEQDERQRLAEEARLEKEAEKEQKALWDSNYQDLMVGAITGRLTRSMLVEAIEKRMVSPEKVVTLKTALDSLERGDGDNVVENPYVKSSLAESITLGRDVSEELDHALRNKQIKPETYVSLRQKTVDISYRRGLGYVTDALKPGMADQWSPDRNVRFAEAVDQYDAMIDAGTPPEEASKRVVSTFLRDRRRSVSGIPMPTYLRGGVEAKIDPGALVEAEQRTVEAFRNNQLDLPSYQREMQRINELKGLASEIGGIADSTDAADLDGDRLNRGRKANQ